MTHISFYEFSSLVKAILNRAIEDAFLVKNPRRPNAKDFIVDKGKKLRDKRNNPDFTYNTSKQKRYLAYEARQFLSKDNDVFCAYCEILDIDPDALAEKCHKKFKQWDKNKKITSPIDFLNVNTLS